MLREQPDEFRQLGQLLDVGNVSEVAGQNRRHIGPRPVLPAALALTADSFGKAPEQGELDQIIADNRFLVPLKFPREQALQEGRRCAHYFCAGQRQHPQGFHPPRQAVGDPRQGQHISGTGQQEPARTIVLIH